MDNEEARGIIEHRHLRACRNQTRLPNDPTMAVGRFRRRAFSVTELLIVVAVLTVLAAVFLPSLARSHARSSRIGCANNLKQMGLAFKTWALDNNDRYPMEVPLTNGGTMELRATAVVFPHFQVMSNELSTPKILVCPNDAGRAPATNFEGDLQDVKLSYFVCLDASEVTPSLWVCGDRGFTNCVTPPTAVLDLGTNSSIGWGKRVHREAGYICLADGSVQDWDNRLLSQATRAMRPGTNRVAVP